MLVFGLKSSAGDVAYAYVSMCSLCRWGSVKTIRWKRKECCALRVTEPSTPAQNPPLRSSLRHLVTYHRASKDTIILRFLEA